MPAGDVHGDALDFGAERRLLHARPYDCARAAGFRVNRCQDIQVTTSGAEDEQLTTWARQRTRCGVMGLRRAAHNDFGAEDEPVEFRGTVSRSGNRSSASSVSAGDKHGDAPDHGVECRHPHALAFESAWQKPHSSRHTARMWSALGLGKCSCRTSVGVRRRALALLQEHDVLGHESLSVCEV